MWIRIGTRCFLLLVFFGYQNVGCFGYLRSCCPKFERFYDTGWYELGHDGLFSSVCKNGITSMNFNNGGGTLKINFQPKNQFGVLGVSFCQDSRLEDCYVAEIFGLISGRLGYYWRKHSQNETGEAHWVPGRNSTLPSTVLQKDLTVNPGTWDPEGKTVYQFYIETEFGDYKRILYNGGFAKQQKEMNFFVHNDKYTLVTIASYNDSTVTVEGAAGCSNYKRMQFQPGQDIWLYASYEPSDMIGISFCTDSGQFECYVLEVHGQDNGNIKYFWRKHSTFEESGEDGWIPGKNTKLKGIVLAEKEVEPVFYHGKEAAKPGISIYIKRTLDDKLEFGMNRGYDQYLYYRYTTKYASNSSYETFDIPNEYRFATVETQVLVPREERKQADLSVFGPCFNGNLWGYITPSCKQEIPARDPSYENQNFYIYSPRPGRAEAILVSEILESKAVRKTLCMSLLGIASNRGDSIFVTATDASGKSNETVQVGQLTYNNIYPPVWQRVRISVDLPPTLQSVPLIIKIISKRQTAESTVFLSEAKLCSDDGCGLPTAKGTPYIAHGKKTSPAKYPWHVAIFKTENNEIFDFTCGGSLIRSNAVLSAAHCFFNNQSKLEDKSKYKFAVGKVYNTLYEFEPHQQFSDALDIHVPSRYTGVLGNYIYDIAIVQVKFTTSPLVLPVCLDWFGNTLPGLQAGNVGEVAGWGVTETGVESEELLFGRLPYIPYSKCIETVPETFVAYVTPDKFCAGNVNGTTVKKGDSGGGLAFKTGGLWYLRGIVSTGVPNELTYSTFTDVSQFIPWIKDVLNITKND